MPHTRKWFRKEQSLTPAVIDRPSFEGWEIRIEKMTLERAQNEVEKLITTYQLNKISEEQRQELRAVAFRAAKKFEMDSLSPLPQGE